jgi:NADH dehydrogenase
MAGVTVVVSAVHGFVGPRGISPQTVDRDGNRNLIDAAGAEGVDVVLMSIVGASADSPLELSRMKYEAEQHLLDSGVHGTVVRATAFAELWVELLQQTAGRRGRPLVFGKGDNPLNFVSVRDVAGIVGDVVTDESTRGATIEVGGSENLTFNELAAAVQRAAGRPGPPRHVPVAMLAVMANTIGRLKPELARQTRAAIAMDRANLSWSPSGDHGSTRSVVGPTTVHDLLGAVGADGQRRD